MTLNWGILGAAKFARQQMGPAIAMAKGSRIAAVASSSESKVEPFRAFAPDLAFHESYDALLADPNIDAVYVPLPNHLHVEWTIKALEAGKHVLCEKPLAMRAEEFDPVIAKRDETGLLAAEAFMIVHHPQWQLARDLVQAGEIGTLMHVDAVFSYNNSDGGNIRNRPETGGGSLPDIGVYTLGSVRFVTGQEPLEIAPSQITWENGVDVTARVNVGFEGFTFSSLTSMRMAQRQEVVFHGDKGVLRLPAPFNPGVYAEAQVHLEVGHEIRSWRFPSANHYVNQVENFAAAVNGQDEYPCTLEFVKGTQLMIDRVLQKAKA